jgi:biopolymer transport protein TolQ
MKLDPFRLILDADIVVKCVIFLLLAASFVCWAIIYQKIVQFRHILKDNQKFLDFYDQSSLDQVYKKSQKIENNPLANVLRAGFQEFEKAKQNSKIDTLKNIQRTVNRARQQELSILENRIPFLATTGSSAPFIGLFGTVWGIMNSFLNIGSTGATNLAVVAPGIAEALIATAIGLFAAIPAVIGYNYCVSKIRTISQDLDQLSNDMMNSFQRDHL